MTQFLKTIGNAFLLCVCPFFVSTSFGQNTFQYVFGESGAIVESANFITPVSGGYLVAGTGWVFSDADDGALLMKIDPHGSIVWQKTYDQIGPADRFYHVVAANDGGYLAVGETNWTVDADLLLVKTDDNGNLQWQKRIGLDGWQTGQIGYRVLPVSNGYIVSGGYSAFGQFEDALLLRIDNSGNMLWAQRYSDSPATTHLEVQFASNDTLYAVGYKDQLALLATINAANGELISVQTFDGPSQYGKSFNSMAVAANGDFLLAGNVYSPVGNPRLQWVCRLSRNGELKWSKTYSNVGSGPIVALSDGHFALSPAFVTLKSVAELDATLIKIDGDGTIDWAYKYGKAGLIADWFVSACANQGGGVVAVGGHQTSTSGPIFGEMMLTATDKNGRVEGCCRRGVNTFSADYQPVILPSTLNQTPYTDTMENAWHQMLDYYAEIHSFCPAGPPEQSSREVFICPGDSVVIDGLAHFSPGTVTSNVPGPFCDTVVTYNIKYSSTGTTSVLDLKCPPDQLVALPPGVDSGVVHYPSPVGQSDCVCPGIELVPTQGLPSGSVFAVGTHQICYAGKDNCQQSSECCFQVKVVQEEGACDIKTNGCLTFELLRITRDAHWRRTYQLRVTNNCTQNLVYAAFELPEGVTAEGPADNQTYTAPGGRLYGVRNPNYSPFYSIRYGSQGAGIAGGASDVFRYTLPPQLAPDYIQVVAKTSDQAHYAAYLNTFNCPVELEQNASKPREDSNGNRSAEPETIRLSPNPAADVLFAELPGVESGTVNIRILNTRGMVVFADQQNPGGQRLRVDLPAGMASGVYLFEAIPERGARRAKRFVLR